MHFCSHIIETWGNFHGSPELGLSKPKIGDPGPFLRLRANLLTLKCNYCYDLQQTTFDTSITAILQHNRPGEMTMGA